MGRGFPYLAFLAVAIVVCYPGAPAFAGSPSGDGYRPESVDQLLNDDATTGQLNGWHGSGEGGYVANQIVSDARLAHQLSSNSDSDGNSLISGVGIKKHHGIHPAIIVALAVGGFLALATVVVLIWSRIVSYREMREASTVFEYSRPTK